MAGQGHVVSEQGKLTVRFHSKVSAHGFEFVLMLFAYANSKLNNFQVMLTNTGKFPKALLRPTGVPQAQTHFQQTRFLDLGIL